MGRTPVNPADSVTHWPIDKLIPYARNSRTHSDEQVSQIAASIKEWGFTTAVLVDESGSIIAGHGRLMAARKLGLETVPVMVAAGWTEAQKRAYVIADNRLAELAGWDTELLALELEELRLDGYDLDLTGFDADAIEAMFENAEPSFDPGTEDDQSKLDELAPKIVECPHCGKGFDIREQS